MDEALKRAKSYSNKKHILSLAGSVITILFFVIIQTSGFSGSISDVLEEITSNSYFVIILYLITIGVLLQILSFPLDYLSSFRIEHSFSLSRQAIGSWLKDYTKKVLIGGILYLAMLVVLYIFLKKTPSLWWFYTSLSYFFLSVVLAKLFPLLIIPLFYKLTKMDNELLKERLIKLAKNSGVRVLDIYKIALGEKTKKANAAVCGIGSTKRILLSDTMLSEYSPEEIEATLAHELSHHKHHHFWKLTLLSLILSLVSFSVVNIVLIWAFQNGRIGSISDIRGFPFIAVTFLAFNFISLPLSNFISRRYETEADLDAISLINKPACFAGLMKKLSLQNLSDPSPSLIIKLFFYDHPPAQERIDLCRERELKMD